MRESRWSDRTLRLLTNGSYHRISPAQEDFLEQLRNRLVGLGSSPQDLSYAEYLHASGLFTLAREIELNPRGVVLPAQYDIRRFPFSWDGFPLDGLWTPPAPSVVESYGANTLVDSKELADYVLFPLQQEIIDDYLLGDDQLFLRMIAHRLYPIGLSRYSFDVHGAVVRPKQFGQHDLLHARINLRAWRDMVSKANDLGLSPVLQSWYQRTQDLVELVAENLVVAIRRIEDVNLRRAVQAVAWDLFHENEIPFNALDAYSLVFYHGEGRDTGSRFELGTYYSYQKTYGSNVKYTEALRWHLTYWQSLLPSHGQARAELLRAQEEYLLANKKIKARGAVRWEHERLRD